MSFAASKNIKNIIAVILMISAFYSPLISHAQLSNPDPQEPQILTSDEVATTNQANSQNDQQTLQEIQSATAQYCSNNPATWFTGCIVEAFFTISARILILAGWVFDGFLWFTLDNNVFLNQNFISDVWSELRDLANVGFILVLIYLSYRLIIKGASDNIVRNLIIKLILIALLINFSLFIARVIVDAGNITALSFYNAMDIREEGARSERIAGGFGNNIERKSVAGALVQSFNPAKILDTEVFATIANRTGDATAVPGAGNAALAVNAVDKGALYAAITILMLGFIVMNVAAAWMLFKSGIFFATRSIWLIILTVISPLAFVAYFFPNGSKWFNSWLKTLVDKCFCLPVYLFLIWLLLKFLESTGVIFDQQVGADESAWKLVLVGVTIQFLLVYTLLNIALKLSKQMCDGVNINGKNFSIADRVQGGLKKAGMGALTTVGPGRLASIAARGTVGRAAYNAMEGKGRLGGYLKDKAAEGSTSALIARNQLKNIANLKMGNDKGYQEKLKDRANRKIEEANEIENLKKGRVAKDLQNKYVADLQKKEPGLSKDDAIVRYKKDADAYDRDQKAAEKAGQDNGNQYLRERTKDTTKSGGLLRRSIDLAANGLVPASSEAYDRRNKQIQADADKQFKIDREKEKQARVAQEAAVRKDQIDQNKNNFVKDAVASIRQGGGVDLSKNTLKKLGDSLALAFSNQAYKKGEDLEQIRKKLTDTQKKELDLASNQITENVREVTGRREENLKDLNKEMKELSDQQSEIRESSSKVSREVEILEQIRQEMRGGQQDVDVNEERKAILDKYNIEHNGEYISGAKLADVGSNLANSRNVLMSNKEMLKTVDIAARKKEKEIDQYMKEYEKELNKAADSVTGPLKARINSRVRSGEFETGAKAENILEEAQAKQAGLQTGRAADLDPNLTDGN